MNKIKYISLFSGIGSPEQALTNLNIPYELIGFSEIDKFAIKSYCAIHNISESKNLGDITKIDTEKLPTDIDLLTHGSPCQDYSIGGQQKGGDKGSGTRSSLMWNSVEIINHCKPKIILWENVKNVLSKNHRHNFDKYIEDLDKIGYNNYYKVINAKYYVPQNRERVFVISIRKDVDDGTFKFPTNPNMSFQLRDILEEDVEEKYYLSDLYQERFLKSLSNNEIQMRLPKTGAVNILGTTVNPRAKGPNTRHWVYDTEKIMGCLTATDYKQPKQILVARAITCGSHRYYTPANIKKGQSTLVMEELYDKFRIRKLTPCESWLLMGFKKEQFKKAKEVCSDTQLYKQAGNSIVVNVLEELFKALYLND